MRINPFKPGSPVPVGMFAGRLNELDKLEHGFAQTRAGQPINFLVTGDRGIGKSSLLWFESAVARGKVESGDFGYFKFCVASTQISEKTDLVTFLKILQKEIAREVGKTEVVRKFLAETWDFLQRVKIMDSSIDRARKDSEEEIVISDFCHSLAETVARITQPGQGEDRREGLVIVIDEADNASAELRLGYLLKTITEALLRASCNHVCFIVAGLPDTFDKLRQSHESSVRIFDPLPIRELEIKDRRRVVELGMAEANKLNVAGKITIAEDAKEQIALLSEGYPHFIQQFAFSAFNAAKGSEITLDDVNSSAYSRGGAIETIGLKYYQSDFYDKIKSDEYRQVLKIMAARGNDWIKKSEIRAEFKGTEGRLSNAIQALTSRRIIQKDSAKDGVYRLQQRGFALWIQYFGDPKSAR
ncbi:AAA family ATPase [Stenotrophomonas sp. S4]